MFFLVESPIGIALFNESNDNYTLVDKYPFKTLQECNDTISAINKGEIPNLLKEFILRNCQPSSTLNILNPNLTGAMDSIRIVCEPNETFRKIRNNIFKYFGIPKDKYNETTFKMAQSLIDSNTSIDTVLIDVLSSIEELETAINNRIMRIREWYSIHFPELNAVSDHMQYLKYVLKIGNRSKFTEHKDIPQEIDYLVSNSMGTEVKDCDVEKISNDVNDILGDIEFKNQQLIFLRSATKKAFPNLYNLIGDILTIKLIRKAGSISQLSQKPSSTIQILGSEKAYNEAVKNKGNTPKYGYIFYSEFISNAPDELKGKIARFLSNKIALCARADSDPNNKNGDFGLEIREKLINQIEMAKYREKASKKPIKNTKKRVISVKDYNTSRDDSKRSKKN